MIASTSPARNCQANCPVLSTQAMYERS